MIRTSGSTLTSDTSVSSIEKVRKQKKYQKQESQSLKWRGLNISAIPKRGLQNFPTYLADFMDQSEYEAYLNDVLGQLGSAESDQKLEEELPKSAKSGQKQNVEDQTETGQDESKLSVDETYDMTDDLFQRGENYDMTDKLSLIDEDFDVEKNSLGDANFNVYDIMDKLSLLGLENYLDEDHSELGDGTDEEIVGNSSPTSIPQIQENDNNARRPSTNLTESDTCPSRICKSRSETWRSSGCLEVDRKMATFRANQRRIDCLRGIVREMKREEKDAAEQVGCMKKMLRRVEEKRRRVENKAGGKLDCEYVTRKKVCQDMILERKLMIESFQEALDEKLACEQLRQRLRTMKVCTQAKANREKDAHTAIAQFTRDCTQIAEKWKSLQMELRKRQKDLESRKRVTWIK